KREAALARLNTVAEREGVDPYLFLCRAEILRDTQRQAARADLVRYQTVTRASGVTNKAQDKRVTGLIATLDLCLKTGATRCRGEWEQPRIKFDSSKRLAPAPTDGEFGEAPAAGGQELEAQNPAYGEGMRLGDKYHDVQLVIDVATGRSDYGGNIFLVGHRALDIGGRPVGGIQPADFHQLGMWVQRLPFRTEAKLIEGIHYEAIYSHRDYPLPQDRVSAFFQINETPPGEVAVLIDRYASNRSLGRDEEDDANSLWKGPSKEVAPATTVVIDMEPPPEDTSGRIFVAGFETVNEKTTMPSRDQIPADYHVIEGVERGLPIRDQLQLVKGLHYLAMYGFGRFPGKGDRLSITTLYEAQGRLSFVIKDEFAGGDPATGRPPTVAAPANAPDSTPAPEEDRTWLALLIGLLVAGAVLWMARRSD
ncbi:MAG: hypothetical protein QF464_18315, partial [Myxococcota bacterium]|nr:hypothetical protein [Myxococcota bacterium]